ncbi:hypothetical protein D3C79_769320 [compost metagenome]
MAVRDPIEAERAHQHVQVDDLDARAEHPLLHATLQRAAQRLQHQAAHLADGRGFLHVLAVVDVFGADHAHEIDVAVVVVEGELGQALDGLLGRQRLQVQAVLGLADVAVQLDQALDVQLLLAAEVVVDHALGGGRALGDGIHPRARQALLDELVDGGLEDVLAGFFRVVLARLACPFDLGLAEGGNGIAHSCSRGIYWDLDGIIREWRVGRKRAVDRVGRIGGGPA